MINYKLVYLYFKNLEMISDVENKDLKLKRVINLYDSVLIILGTIIGKSPCSYN
jgi:hypothetical protein